MSNKYFFYYWPGCSASSSIVATLACAPLSLRSSFNLSRLIVFVFVLLLSTAMHAQQANRNIQKGNEAYKKGDYSEAIEAYKKAITQSPKDFIAQFNLGNAYSKTNDALTSEKDYDDVITNSTDTSLQSKAYYNKALSLLNQKKLEDAAAALKQSLRINPNDDDARENLQKVLNELKKQQPPPLQSKNNKQQQKQPPQKQDKTKMNKQTMEQKFAELRNQERQLQKQLQLQKNNIPVGQPEKDW